MKKTISSLDYSFSYGLKLSAGEHVSLESDMQEISHEPLESRDSDDPFERPPYYVPCRNPLSRSQKRIVEERVRAIRSEIPICVAVMKNNNIGVAQRWMLVSSILSCLVLFFLSLRLMFLSS
jgi:hypothetical protein